MIFYFSGTGNSRWAAKMLAQETDDRLVAIPEAIKGDCSFSLAEDEQVGFVFPVHGWRVPRIVREFIGKLSFQTEADGGRTARHYCFCLVTAGDTAGKAVERFRQLLAAVPAGGALSLEAVCSLVMPESYVGLPGMDVDTKEKELEKKRVASEQLELFAGGIKNRLCGEKGQPRGWEDIMRGPVPALFSGPVGAFFDRFLITDKPFHVVSSRCVKCGICANVCPVDDIKGGLGYEPEWLHNGKCLTCFSCYHHCPHHAIEYGRRTQKKGQYFFSKLRKLS